MANSYKSLSDCSLFSAGDDIEIWYKNSSFFPHGIVGNSSQINTKDLTQTHILLGTISSSSRAAFSDNLQYSDFLEWLYESLQGERWSPNGEARQLILNKGIEYTSMSVGDVIRFKNGKTFFCSTIGWKKLNG